jgi:hypothetical protein
VANFILLILTYGITGLIAFTILKWLQIPAGNIGDWLVGGAIFAWLLTIVIIPWNIHFSAREVLAEAETSKERGIPIDGRKYSYIKLLAKRSLIIAIALHLISTGVLYYLAANGITTIGYVGAIAALLLTILRPIVRSYLFWVSRIESIKQEFINPREDIVELRQRLSNLEQNMQQVQQSLNPENQLSWAFKQGEYIDELRSQTNRLMAVLEELRATNTLEHERLTRESKQLVAQITTDGQFLDHVREIIRFFKSA